VAVAVLSLVGASGPAGAARPLSAGDGGWGWVDLNHGTAPPASAGDLLVYDAGANRFIEFGGWNGTTMNDTWTLDPTTGAWVELHPRSSPPVRADASFVYDSVDGLCYLFGGWNQFPNGTYVRYGDTWSFSLAADRWTELFPSGSPSPRSDSAVAFDAADNEVVLVGGFSGTTYLGDEWTFSPSHRTWTPLAPSGPSPSPRADGRMAYDSVDGTMILFGGNDYSGPNFTFHHLADTWRLVPLTGKWTEVSNLEAPPARDYAVQAFDPVRDWVLLTSGFGNRTILNDLWAFSPLNSTWWPLATSTPPPGRYAGVGGFDVADGILILSGGAGTSGLLNDTWSLEPLNTSAPSPNGSGGPGLWIVLVVLAGGAVAVVVVRRPRLPAVPPPRRGN
jgi:Galactose oxidase, central domain